MFCTQHAQYCNPISPCYKVVVYPWDIYPITPCRVYSTLSTVPLGYCPITPGYTQSTLSIVPLGYVPHYPILCTSPWELYPHGYLFNGMYSEPWVLYSLAWGIYPISPYYVQNTPSTVSLGNIYPASHVMKTVPWILYFLRYPSTSDYVCKQASLPTLSNNHFTYPILQCYVHLTMIP